MNTELAELTPDDREILEDMLFPVFQSAVAKDKNVTRLMIREEIANVFPWPHVSEMLKELETKEYIHRMSTRDGGIYTAGEYYARWAEAMKPIEYPEDRLAAGAGRGEASNNLTISQVQAESLVSLVRDLAARETGDETLQKVHEALSIEGGAADKILALLVGR